MSWRLTHGNSDRSPTGHYSLDYLASDLRAVAAQLDRKPVLVGASLGGMTALIAESERPPAQLSPVKPFLTEPSTGHGSLCRALVLVDITPRTEPSGIERIFAFMSSHPDGFASLDEAAEAVAAYLSQRPRPSDHRRLAKNLRLRGGRYYWHWDPIMLARWRQIAGLDQTDSSMPEPLEERLYRAARALTVPTLLVRGDKSDVVSETILSEFIDAVPHVRSVRVAGAGHMVADDSNHTFTQAVIEFLTNIDDLTG